MKENMRVYAMRFDEKESRFVKTRMACQVRSRKLEIYFFSIYSHQLGVATSKSKLRTISLYRER